MAARTERLGTAAGVAAPAVAVGAILLATLLSPTFTWTGSALSDLGAPGAPTAALFNGGLVLGGALALPFAARLVGAARNRVEAAGAGVFGLAAVALAGVGLFPLDTPQHTPVAVAFFLLLSLSLWTYGAGNVLAGDRRLGAVTVLLGLLNLAAWVVYLALFEGLGLALPEAVGTAVLAAWSVGTAGRLREAAALGRSH
jgi:hypothetical membrane protein